MRVFTKTLLKTSVSGNQVPYLQREAFEKPSMLFLRGNKEVSFLKGFPNTTNDLACPSLQTCAVECVDCILKPSDKVKVI